MKKLMYFFMSFVLVTSILGVKSSANASSYSTGKAIIPSYVEQYAFATVFNVSNITDNPITVTVTLFNTDGTILTDDNNMNAGRISGVNLLNYSDQNTDSTLTFTLNPHATGQIITKMNTSITNVGYGVIQWRQEGNAAYGLVAHSNVVYNVVGDSSRYAIPINGGLPF
jgi:hypothetical protein